MFNDDSTLGTSWYGIQAESRPSSNVSSRISTPGSSRCATPALKGRPMKTYDGSSEKTKRRRAKALAQDTVVEQTLEAARIQLKDLGREGDVEKVKKMKKHEETQKIAYSPAKALTILIENNLTKQAYQNLR